MPQLVPFYFMNLLTWGVAIISIVVYIVSTIILPNILRLLIARNIIIRI